MQMSGITMFTTPHDLAFPQSFRANILLTDTNNLANVEAGKLDP